MHDDSVSDVLNLDRVGAGGRCGLVLPSGLDEEGIALQGALNGARQRALKHSQIRLLQLGGQPGQHDSVVLQRPPGVADLDSPSADSGNRAVVGGEAYPLHVVEPVLAAAARGTEPVGETIADVDSAVG